MRPPGGQKLRPGQPGRAASTAPPPLPPRAGRAAVAAQKTLLDLEFVGVDHLLHVVLNSFLDTD